MECSRVVTLTCSVLISGDLFHCNRYYHDKLTNRLCIKDEKIKRVQLFLSVMMLIKFYTKKPSNICVIVCNSF